MDYNNCSNTIDIQSDGQYLPFKNLGFDSIISIDVLEHFENPEDVIKELYRVLKQDGYVILSTPFFFYSRRTLWLFLVFTL